MTCLPPGGYSIGRCRRSQPPGAIRADCEVCL